MKNILIIGTLLLLIQTGRTTPLITNVSPVYPPVENVTVIPSINLEFATSNEPVVERLDLQESVKLLDCLAKPVYELTDYERYVVECMVMGEIGGESYEGQVLVAQCILNAMLKDDLTPSEVRVNYQYSGWNDYPSDSVKQAVAAVFDCGETVVDEPILYFYAPALCVSTWHESQVFVIEEGNTRFFKEW